MNAYIIICYICKIEIKYFNYHLLNQVKIDLWRVISLWSIFNFKFVKGTRTLWEVLEDRIWCPLNVICSRLSKTVNLWLSGKKFFKHKNLDNKWVWRITPSVHESKSHLVKGVKNLTHLQGPHFPQNFSFLCTLPFSSLSDKSWSW